MEDAGGVAAVHPRVQPGEAFLVFEVPAFCLGDLELAMARLVSEDIRRIL